jgi:hypothetical protein
MKKKQSIEDLKNEGIVTTADKVFVNGKEITDEFQKEILKKQDEYQILSLKIQSLQLKNKWIEEIEDYCSKEGISPRELILSLNKPQKSPKGSKTSKSEDKAANQSPSGENSRSNFMQDLKFKKTGIK